MFRAIEQIFVLDPVTLNILGFVNHEDRDEIYIHASGVNYVQTGKIN